MATLTFQNIRVSGLSACVPKTVRTNAELTDLLPPAEIDRTIQNIGIVEKRFASPGDCASDLCYVAASRLLAALNVAPETIDVLIFMSQLPDYPVPATAPSLQHRLGLPETCASFDISLGCSGYVYALASAFLYAAQPTIRRVLLLDGETFTRVVSQRDKVNAPLYGDAGTATLVEKGESGPAYFSLYSSGAGQDKILIKAGGARHPASSETIVAREAEEGNVRTDHQLYMDGMEVFNFTIRVVPASILEVLRSANTPLADVDYVVFHQANKFMTDFFAKKIKCPKEKVPYSLGRFGNTSSASIPLTIVTELQHELATRKRVLMSGFGAGLSWGAALLEFSGCVIPPLAEL
jgi:3-oxoacyl-[acyl-carrier-protein] synthase III